MLVKVRLKLDLPLSIVFVDLALLCVVAGQRDSQLNTTGPILKAVFKDDVTASAVQAECSADLGEDDDAALTWSFALAEDDHRYFYIDAAGEITDHGVPKGVKVETIQVGLTDQGTHTISSTITVSVAKDFTEGDLYCFSYLVQPGDLLITHSHTDHRMVSFHVGRNNPNKGKADPNKKKADEGDVLLKKIGGIIFIVMALMSLFVLLISIVLHAREAAGNQEVQPSFSFDGTVVSGSVTGDGTASGVSDDTTGSSYKRFVIFGRSVKVPVAPSSMVVNVDGMPATASADVNTQPPDKGIPFLRFFRTKS